MQMRFLGLVLLVACSGVDSSPNGAGSFDDEVVRFRDTICEVGARCSGEDLVACKTDVTTDMNDAKAALDQAGQARCATCVHVKRVEAQRILDAACDFAAADIVAVLDVCDLDPAIDYDQDGTPDNDDDEACAGYP